MLHFGMTGNIHVCFLANINFIVIKQKHVQVKGQVPLQYKEVKRKANDEWPPKFMKVFKLCTVILES